MGLYLSEINMPKGEGSKLVLQIFPNGEVYDEHYIRLGIAKWAEAIPVPEHGRLIDADALEKEAQKRMLICDKNGNQFQKQYEIMRAIALAPTIIPAEEGEA